MRCICLLLFLFPLLCPAQRATNDLTVLVGTGVGGRDQVTQYRSYSVGFQRTVARFDGWIVRVGWSAQVDDATLSSTGHPGNRTANDPFSFRATASTVSLGGTISLSRLLGAYSAHVFLQPQYVAFDDLAVEEDYAHEYGIALQRRPSLDSGFGIRRHIGPRWSVGILGRIPLLAPRVDLLRSNVICPIIAPCTVFEEQPYDSRPLRLPSLSVLVGYGF